MNRGRNHSADHGSGNRLHYVRANTDRKSTRLNSSHSQISYAVFCLKKKKKLEHATALTWHCDFTAVLSTVSGRVSLCEHLFLQEFPLNVRLYWYHSRYTACDSVARM